MKWLLEEKWIGAGFSLAMVLMGGVSLISYQNATQLAESTNQVRQTHEVLETLTNILSILNESDAGRRGYILFKDPLELERYNRAIQLLDPTLKQLQALSRGNSEQKHRLKLLRQLIDRRLDLAQQSIQLYRQSPSTLSAQISLRLFNTRNRQEIQKLIAVMQQQEENALERWVNQSQASIKLRMTLEALGTLLTFLILVVIFTSLHRQVLKRQQAENSQQRLVREKELSELKFQFFSMISHEFRTPLSSILGSAQILEETLQPLVAKQKLKSLHRIRSSTQLMIQLLSDVLTLARVEAGKLEFHPKLVEMQSFCLNLLEDVKSLSQPHHSIQFTMGGECVYAYVDERLLYSILSNLVSNAIKYSPKGGMIDFVLSCEFNLLTFQIKDEGIGIAPEVKTNLYEPFRRGGNVGGILGTGLGLVVTKKYIDLHRGTISIESEVNVGTTVTVTIPQACRSS